MRLYLVPLLLCIAAPLPAQTFECLIGTTSACLQPGETVCSARGQCVGRNALCFDAAACDADGFTCASNVRVCQDDMQDLADLHAALQARHEALQGQYRELATDAETLLVEYDRLVDCVRDSAVSTNVMDCLR